MDWEQNLILAVYGITLITGFPANLLALYAFVRKLKQKAKPIDVLLLSLNISDLFFLFNLPFRMKEVAEEEWTVSYFFCSVSVVIFFTTIYNSIIHLTAISVERYLAVAFPIKHKLRCHPRNAVIASVIFWVISMAHCSIIFIIQYQTHSNKTSDTPGTCYDNFRNEQMEILMPFRLEMFVLFFCIPCIICCFCYLNLILILSRLSNVSPKKRFRAIGLAVGTLLVFIICFMPYNISHLVGFLSWFSPNWRKFTLLPSTFNACLDPFIFYFSSSALREMVKLCIQGLIKRLSFCPKALCCPQHKGSSIEEKTQGSSSSLH